MRWCSRKANALDGITAVVAHPQALAQCDRYLRSLPGIEVVTGEDDTAARYITGNQPYERRIATGYFNKSFGAASTATSSGIL